MKKKIGIITLSLFNYNYGGILQNFALQQFLIQNFDCEVQTINLENTSQGTSFMQKVKIKIYKSFIFDFNSFRDRINIKLKEFIDKKIVLSTIKVVDKRQFNRLIKEEKLNVLIVGSDQIWRFDYLLESLHDVAMLKTDHQILKLSYAASFGVEEWDYPELTEKFIAELRHFKSVSVRESSGMTIFDNYFQIKNADFHIDPTLLFSQDFYLKIIGINIENEKKNILYAYILDMEENIFSTLSEIKEQMKIDLMATELLENILQKINRKNWKSFTGLKAKPVELWLRNFYEAKYIITDSFHGMVFSIIFEKQFVVLGNEKRGLARFSSLLNQLDLSNRLLISKNTDSNEIERLLKTPIDYDAVSKVLHIERKRAFQYFSKNIVSC